MRLPCQWMALLSVSAASLIGCGGENTTPSAQLGEASVVETKPVSNLPPTTSITVPAPELTVDPDDLPIKPPEPGSPEAIVMEMTQLWLKPFADTDDVEKQRVARRERNEQIVGLAKEVIAKTNKDPEKEQVFNIAVHRLMEATFQLAMQGDQDGVEALYQNANDLFKKKPKSKAAAEAAWFVAKFANENAIRFAESETRWVKEFARQARSFADKFPQDQNRAIGLLNDAGASCDFYGLRDDAMQCYGTIRQKFPESPQAEQVVAPLRRLNLPGSKVDLGGPTIEGGFISVEELKGSPVLVVFWSTEAKPFVEQSKSLIATTHKFEAKGLHVIGVNLDSDESAIDTFAEKSGMSWRNIFHADPAKRGWSSPIATYYGVQIVPQMWLINTEGIVISTGVLPKDLDAELTKLVGTQKVASKPAVQ